MSYHVVQLSKWEAVISLVGKKSAYRRVQTHPEESHCFFFVRLQVIQIQQLILSFYPLIFYFSLSLCWCKRRYHQTTPSVSQLSFITFASASRKMISSITLLCPSLCYLMVVMPVIVAWKLMRKRRFSTYFSLTNYLKGRLDCLFFNHH